MWPRCRPRYRSCYFSHAWTGYAANYYAYLWSEVMDADAYAWFNANGGMTRANGDKFRAAVLSQGEQARGRAIPGPHRPRPGRGAAVGETGLK